MTGRDKLLNEVLEVYKKHNYNGVALIPTGSGKGKIMIEIMRILNTKSVLYLCDREELRDKMFLDELHKWGAAHYIPYIDRVCYQTAYKWVGKHYDLVLADEFDAALSDKYKRVFENNTFKYKVLVSATLEDSQKIKAKKIAPIIFERTQKELINEKVLNRIQFYYINYDLSAAENNRYIEFNKTFAELLAKSKTPFVAMQLDKLQISRKHFLSSLTSSRKVTHWLLEKLRTKNEKVLIFCGLSEQANSVSEHSYHSTNNNAQALRDFEAGKIKELAVVEKLTRGVNISGVKNIVLEHFGKSKTKFTQKVGRGLRLSVDDVLSVFILIPHYKHHIYGRKPTILKDWAAAATKDMDIFNAKTIEYKQ